MWVALVAGCIPLIIIGVYVYMNRVWIKCTLFRRNYWHGIAHKDHTVLFHFLREMIDGKDFENIKGYGDFIYPTNRDQEFVDGLEHYFTADVNNAFAQTTTKPKDQIIDTIGETPTDDNKQIPPDVMYNTFDPIVLQKMRESDSVKKALEPRKDPNDWIKQIVIVAIVVFGLVFIIYQLSGGTH